MPRGHKNPLWFGLAQRLLDARDAARLPTRDLAALAHCSHVNISRIENGGVIPLVETVERLALALGVDPCWLAFGWDGTAPFTQRVRRYVDPDPAPQPEPREVIDVHQYRELPNRLRQAREAAAMSMRTLSELAGISVEFVSKTERGVSVPNIANVEQLAVALNVSPCWLAFGVGQPPPSTAS